jgi:F-type H+-transporting ATPase subunit delta
MNGHSGKLARRYAQALLRACTPDELDQYCARLGELTELHATHAAFRDALVNPSYAIEQRCAAARDVAHRILPSEKFANFVSEIVRHQRTTLLPEIHATLERAIAELKRILALTVTSAFPIPLDEREHIVSKLRSERGSFVSVEWKVNPDLLGGMTVRSGDRLYDGSVRGSIEKLREQISI